MHEYETICPNWWHLPTHILTASTYGLGQITIPTHTSTVQRMNGKCLLFYLRPVGVFVRSVESFLINSDVKFINLVCMFKNDCTNEDLNTVAEIGNARFTESVLS